MMKPLMWGFEATYNSDGNEHMENGLDWFTEDIERRSSNCGVTLMHPSFAMISRVSRCLIAVTDSIDLHQ